MFKARAGATKAQLAPPTDLAREVVSISNTTANIDNPRRLLCSILLHVKSALIVPLILTADVFKRRYLHVAANSRLCILIALTI